MSPKMKLRPKICNSFFLFGLLSLIWFFLRTGTRPSRASYPCQQASAAAGSLWLATYVLPLLAVVAPQKIRGSKSGKQITIGIALLVGAMLAIYLFDPADGNETTSETTLETTFETVDLDISEKRALTQEASDIFAVSGTSGDDEGFEALINLMAEQGTPFYETEKVGGIIGRDDIVLIKVNCQWDERGGTNTDLAKALVRAVLDHPEGFEGEVVIADNGQGQFGSTGHGGSLDYSQSNAQDYSQSMQDVADSFSHGRVSTSLWDDITTQMVGEFGEGDDRDGYVVEDGPDPRTGIVVTYPKFTTRYGTKVSFKMGVWDPESHSYDGERLKVINVPVLKSHSIYGVTASVKHYMGVVSDKLSSQMGGRAHRSVGTGGMGTEMAETMFPALNLLDAIWINAHPRDGPCTPYDRATQTRIIAASTDPIALDYWAAKNVLMPTARKLGYEDLSSMDPDSDSPGSFGSWLKLSMEEMRRGGLQVNGDEGSMNVYVAVLDRG